MKYVYPICSFTDHAMPFLGIHVFHTHVRVPFDLDFVLYESSVIRDLTSYM
jgi:hypothetical protein